MSANQAENCKIVQWEPNIHIFFHFKIKARQKSISKQFKVANGGKMGYIW